MNKKPIEMSTAHLTEEFISEHGCVFAFYEDNDAKYALVATAKNPKEKVWRLRTHDNTLLQKSKNSNATNTLDFTYSKFDNIEGFIAWAKFKYFILKRGR